MTWLDKYFAAVYEDGGRELPRVDCFGLLRLVLAERFGRDDLPTFGHVRHTMPAEFTRCVAATAERYEPCSAEVGAIATVWKGRICVHIAIVIDIEGRPAVLEMNPKRGVTWSRPGDFEARHGRVIYYRLRDSE